LELFMSFGVVNQLCVTTNGRNSDLLFIPLEDTS
jgi:hypothetical protein